MVIDLKPGRAGRDGRRVRLLFALYRHWQNNNPDWFAGIGNEPDLIKHAMHYRNQALRALANGPLADPDPEVW